ncbi:hypothetical protein NQ317_000489 [Molorchus minor]|uniref:Uncharacterized protein n=1 Tax=Molorchus minor TaxID=1323400 RepID=A0ABQ9JBC4_9CUCU|nr:hypothetical protein NQ317_000489 [Molorchus minor]
MCLRSFRGRFVQKELPFRKRVIPEKKGIKQPLTRKVEQRKKINKPTECVSESSEDEEPLSTSVKETNVKSETPKPVQKSTVESSINGYNYQVAVIKATKQLKLMGFNDDVNNELSLFTYVNNKLLLIRQMSPRVTRSGLSTKINARRQKMKKDYFTINTQCNSKTKIIKVHYYEENCIISKKK